MLFHQHLHSNTEIKSCSIMISLISRFYTILTKFKDYMEVSKRRKPKKDFFYHLLIYCRSRWHQGTVGPKEIPVFLNGIQF